MPRQKSSHPQRISLTDSSSSVNFELGNSVYDNSEFSDLINDVVEHVPEDAENFVKKATKIRSRNGKKQKPVLDENLDCYLQLCVFYIQVHQKALDEQCVCKIGEFDIFSDQQLDIPLPCDAPVVYLYISKRKDKCLLYCEQNLDECESKVHYWPVTCILDHDVLVGLQSRKLFAIYLKRHTAIPSSKLSLAVFLTQNAFCKLNFPSEPVRKTTFFNVERTFHHFFNLDLAVKEWTPKVEKGARRDIESLYSHIREEQESSETTCSKNVQHEDLIPTLRKYQANAVHWMLMREGEKPFDCEQLHSLFAEVRLEEMTFYCNKFSGILTKTKPKVTKPPTGGILADEMGLGKTVEVLACILCHQRPSEQWITQKSNICVKNNSNEEKEINNYGGNPRSVSQQKKRKDCDDYTYFPSEDESDEDFVEEWFAKERKKRKNVDLEKFAWKRRKNSNVNWEKFEGELHCVCGLEKSQHCHKTRIQCTKCRIWQHPGCVHFNSEEMLAEHYLCPHCWAVTEQLVPSRATLVVSPSSIICQWQEEIEKHVKRGALKFLVYSGVSSDGYVQPQTLTDNDIVLISYETLRKELNYVNLPHSNSDEGRRFRNPKRFMAIPSPLVAVEWWRICLDEAQMVEAVSTKTAEMVLRLTALNRWCVTGTPIQKGVEDLYGLLCFLDEDPYCVNRWWKEILYKPYCEGNQAPLVQVMKNCFWRTAKKNVLGEMGLLEQTEKIHWLVFSPVEEHFYKRQRQKCAQDALKKINSLRMDLNLKLSSLNKHTMDVVLNPLRRLRQACCHPQAVRGHLLPLQKTTMTMEDLLQSLTKKTKRECEEAHRLLISSTNGIAAIHIIKQEYVDAVEKYREALRSIEDHRHNIKTDRIQQLHTLHNLAEVLEGDGKSFGNTTETTSENSDAVIDFSAEDSVCNLVDSGISVPSESSGVCSDTESLTSSGEDFGANSNGDGEATISSEITVQDSFQSVPEFSNEISANRLLVVHDADCVQNEIIVQSQNHKEAEEIASELNPPSGVGRTLMDNNLRKMGLEIRNSYLTKCTDQVTAAQEQLAKAASQVEEMLDKFLCDNQSPWWFRALSYTSKNSDGDILINRIKGELLNKQGQSMLSISNRFYGIRGLELVISRLLEELNNLHLTLSTEVRNLSRTPQQEDVNAAIDCHLRPMGAGRKRCNYCKIHEQFNRYEGRLFCFDENAAAVEPSTSEDALAGQLRRGTWADSELEMILKSLLNYAKLQKLDHEIIEDGATHIKVFDLLKKEFRALRGAWMQIRDMASALDELEMAKIRLRLRFPGEPQPNPPVPYILEPEELEPTRLKLASDKVVATNELRKKLGQLFYLQNLAKADFGKKGGSNPEPCPICQKKLGVQWSVLQCGHGFCVECIRILITEYSVGFRNSSVKCAVCRQLTAFCDISYVNTQVDASEEEVPVKGSYSTKVEGIVRCLLNIIKEEPEAKTLVFSTWQSVLEIVGEAFEKNNISYTTLSSNKFQRNLLTFKYDPSVSALLLPIQFGANGLNLIEATHVLLVEPILNTGSEQQAVGRVHRIGQTRATTVHRFIVRNTIEERIYHALQSHHSSINKLDVEDHSLTLNELKKLFEE